MASRDEARRAGVQDIIFGGQFDDLGGVLGEMRKDGDRPRILEAAPLGHIGKVGNAALTGARQMLLSRAKRRDAERIVGQIEHVKLSEQEGFLDRYVQELSLGRWLR